jgi:DNA-binding FadR family transcriptional regulator
MTRVKPVEIAADLRERIVSGEWAVTRKLPNERDLALHYGVARNTLRKAVGELEMEGLLSRQVGRGTEIKDPIDHDLIAIMGHILGSSPLDIMNLRLMIEPAATAMAATNSSVADIDAIRAAHEQACAVVDMESFERCDMEFHRRIFDGTRNEFLANLHDILAIVRNREPMIEIRRRHFTDERKLAYCDQHAEIVRALVVRDAEGAAKAMRAHLGARSQNLFGGAGGA